MFKRGLLKIMRGNRPFIIAISGGSGSGKSTVTSLILARLGLEKASVIHQDSYYEDLSYMSLEERRKVNFDAPSSIDKDLLIKHVKTLLEGSSIEKPCYDFITCTRERKTEKVEPTKYIILEGLFSLCFEELLPIIDLKLFVDVPHDLRLLRRIDRDTKVRGQTLESVIQQYQETVRPMHHKYIEPCRHIADFVVPWININDKLINGLASYIVSLV